MSQLTKAQLAAELATERHNAELLATERERLMAELLVTPPLQHRQPLALPGGQRLFHRHPVGGQHRAQKAALILGLQVLDDELELIDSLGEPLRGATELHAAQPRDRITALPAAPRLG